MSSMTVTRKSKILSIFDHRNRSLVIGAALVAMLVIVVAVSATSPTAKPFDHNAYRLYRQGEWVSVPVSSAEAYQIFRHGEVVSPGNPAEGYRIFRLGEWASFKDSVVDLATYHLSERTFVNAQTGFMQYLLSERTFLDPQAGVALYQQSERTSIRVRFNKYQRSEWFGE